MHHVRHDVSGGEYVRHQLDLMRRWCAIYGRTAAEFVERHAFNYACRHDRAGDRSATAPPCDGRPDAGPER